jgi:hypothetical protein
MKFLPVLFFPLALLASESVVDQVFDDPRKLVPSEGVSSLVNIGNENVASGSGAKTRLILSLAKDGSSGSANKPAIQFISDPAFGPQQFFRSQIDPDGGIRSAGLVVVPEDREGGLTHLTKAEGGRSAISGAFDFFFRANKEGQDAPAGFSLWTWSGLLGVTLIPSRDGKALLLGAFAPEKVLATAAKADEKVSRVTGRRLSEVEVANGEIYHAAVLITSEGGEVSLKLFLQEGTGPIDVASGAALHGEIEGLRIESAERLEDDADKFAFALNRADFAQTFDLARFRLFAIPPKAFPGLHP